MAPVVVWALFLIVQQQGGVGLAFSSQDACTEARAEFLKSVDTVLVSACTEIPLVPPAAG